jgi:hypothetical protein
MKTLLLAASVAVLLSLAARADALTIRYRRYPYSHVAGGILKNWVVLTRRDPTMWTGIYRCRGLAGGHCLVRRAPVWVRFDPDGSFAASLTGTCSATGTGSRFDILAGNYWCVNGDRGFFRLRRVG